jgi:hypothetical protein
VTANHSDWTKEKKMLASVVRALLDLAALSIGSMERNEVNQVALSTRRERGFDWLLRFALVTQCLGPLATPGLPYAQPVRKYGFG